MKTHKGTAKRFRTTGSGKLVHKKAYASHMLAGKSSARKRRLAIMATAHSTDAPRLRKLLNNGGK
jgi:large subunit ribosomal protein L35